MSTLMANNTAAIISVPLLVFFFALMIGVGFATRRHSKSVDGFVLGGRSVGPWLTAFAFGTSYFSAVIFVGYAGQFGWNFGLASTWIGLGNAFIGSLLAWVILGRRTLIMTQSLGSKTMPDFFEKRYDSKTLKVIAAFITFLLFPEVEIPRNTSPGRPYPNSCWANTPKPSTSLIYAVVKASCATRGIAIRPRSRFCARFLPLIGSIS